MNIRNLVYSFLLITSHLSSVGIGYFLGKYAASKPKIHKKVSTEPKPNNDFIDQVFEEAIGGTFSDKEILQIGIDKKPSGEIGGLLRASGNITGYVTNDEILKQETRYRQCMLTSEEQEILTKWWKKQILNLNFYEAKKLVESKNYTLYVIQINQGRKLLSRVYDPTFVSVRIEDDNYDFAKKFPSDKATIVEIIGMGGQN